MLYLIFIEIDQNSYLSFYCIRSCSTFVKIDSLQLLRFNRIMDTYYDHKMSYP